MRPPLIDTRDIKALISRMKYMFPYYTPEWRFTPEDPDAGTALFLIFADMFHENIKRFNRVPLKNFIAFLNMFNVSVFPAGAAAGFVAFRLSEGAGEPVHIPAGTQVSASPEGRGTVVFETERHMLATPASIVEAYNVSPELDSIYRIEESFFQHSPGTDRTHITMFDFTGPENLQEHSLYLGHEGLFNIGETALVELQVINSLKRYSEPSICQRLAYGRNTQWSYWCGEEWRPFDEVLASDNKIILKKATPGMIEKRESESLNSRWVRCRLKDKRINVLGDIVMDGLKISVDYYDCEGLGGVAPGRVFYNDVPRDPQGFYPLGEYFVLYDNFYLSSQEVFSKKGSLVDVKFTLTHIEKIMKSETESGPNFKDIMKSEEFEEPRLPEVSVLTVSWEYWNGKGWAKLFSHNEYEDIFYHPAAGEVEICFKCPLDMEETYVNDHFDFWIRARVLSIENIYTVPSIYRTPWIENIRLKYHYEGEKYPAEHCLIQNNAEYRNMTSAARGESSFSPFYSFDKKIPAFFMGFDSPPVKGPISIMFSIKQQKDSGEKPLLEWEYLRGSGVRTEWASLKIADETAGFTRSGTVVFAGPGDFARGTIFGRDLYWIRIVNPDGRLEREGLSKPMVRGIYMNCTRVVQHQSIKNEMFETVPGPDGREYHLSMFPVIREEVWVNEAGHLGPDDQDRLAAGQPSMIEVVRDQIGNVLEAWFRWIPVEDLSQSSPEDRHYVIDRLTGTVSFGDGRNGRIPPHLGRDNVRINYKIGGGAGGNVGAFEIKNLQNSIVFVDGVYNPDPTGGGYDTETLEKALARGPQLLRHRNRAVTAEDYQWLAREASQDIVRVKCLPNLNREGKKESGCLSVVVVPGEMGGDSFPELKARVERYLKERSASTAVFQDGINVMEPAYLEISVLAELAVNEVDVVALAEKEAVDKLNEFLHPLTGNFGGRGWEIGQYPHISEFYTLLKSVKNVNHVESVSISVIKVENDVGTEINTDFLDNLPYGMVMNGRHRVAVGVV
ncbi:MAG: hypothetical protein JL50_17965 [Peptococcaceae bacterium BICA1-7]|nr:MAG: hypothetical protein JL50_17965 [Peptococcaceae bacterium BICA1-7]HBV97852.1 putative baseplate assembly protein [Desulfotomaculum sp.]